MKTELSTNSPIENLTSENDLLNMLPKAEAIQFFLEGDAEFMGENKMMVVYGKWGSGKTTLMKYLENNLDQQKFKTVFFEAWQHEKDENLGMSLADAIANLVDEPDKVQNFLSSSAKFLKGFTKGISVKLPSISIPGIATIDLNLQKGLEQAKKELKGKKDGNPSFFKQLNSFKKDFLAIEEQILKQYQLTDSGRILILIDDLDRCEPENVLNLIAALKLFFTYGERSIFLCGIDKDAVSKAVKTKYKDVIKSSEYLEKVFDVSFRIPDNFDLIGLAKYYFPEQVSFRVPNLTDKGKFAQKSAPDLINDFLVSIGFSNPRHLKKVLNKYEILSKFKAGNKFPDLIPNIIIDGKGSITSTIFVIYFIILFEFHAEAFDDLRNTDKKINSYAKGLHALSRSGAAINDGITHLGLNKLLTLFRRNFYLTINQPIYHYFLFQSAQELMITWGKSEEHFPSWNWELSSSLDNESHVSVLSFYSQFLPSKIDELQLSTEAVQLIDQFNHGDQNILVDFCQYLEKNMLSLISADLENLPNFSTDQLIKMCLRIL